MADRYKILPSEVMNRATTFDIYVMDVALTYRSHLQKKQEGKLHEDYTVDDLQQMMSKARTA